MSTLKIRQVRSMNECREDQAATVQALGLRRIRDTAVHDDTLQIRDMINKIDHLIEVEEIDE